MSTANVQQCVIKTGQKNLVACAEATFNRYIVHAKFPVVATPPSSTAPSCCLVFGA